MSLLQLLQEASSQSLGDLKKTFKKDKDLAPLLKNAPLQSVEDPRAFLLSLKHHLLNNQEVKGFIASRSGIDMVSNYDLRELRPLKVEDLTEKNLLRIQTFVQDLFKEHGKVERGTISAEARREITDWVNTSGSYHSLSRNVQAELNSIPSLKPNKPVLLYRGLLFSEGSLKNREKYDGTLEKGVGLAFLDAIRKNNHTVDLKWDQASSWTTSKEIAERFARYSAASSYNDAMLGWFGRMSKGKAVDGGLGFIISTLAQPEDILLDLNLLSIKSNLAGEAEMILKPGTYLARITNKFTVEGDVNLDSPASGSSEKLEHAIKELKDHRLELGPIGGYLNSDSNIWNAVDIIKTPFFAKLATDGATTEVLHVFDKFTHGAIKILGGLGDDDFRADLVSDPKLRDDVTVLKELRAAINSGINHSKFVSDTNKRGAGKLSELTASEYRQTIKCTDIADLEKDLLVKGRVESRNTGQTLRNLSRYSDGPNIDPSRFHMRGAAKQKPEIDAIIKACFEKLHLTQPSDEKEAIKILLNIVRRAFRNYSTARKLKSIDDIIGELKWGKDED